MSDSEVLKPIEDNLLSNEVQDLLGRARVFASKGKCEATKRAYRADWDHFTSWCNEHGFPALPSRPEVIGLYLTALADEGFTTSTMERRMVAISQSHKLQGHASPTTHQQVREIWRGIRREMGSAQEKKRPLMTVELRRIIEQLDFERVIDCRDAALLLVGYSGAFRRSELVSFDIDAVEERSEGVVLKLGHSKTDQERDGHQIGIPYGHYEQTCPVRALRRWLEKAGIDNGPIFRGVTKGGKVGHRRLSSKAVCLVVKRSAKMVGLNPDEYGGHSLRAGMATEAARSGVGEREIMRQTRHTSLTVLRGYIRDGSLFQGNASAMLGL